MRRTKAALLVVAGFVLGVIVAPSAAGAAGMSLTSIESKLERCARGVERIATALESLK
jgi:hypothetical protein